MRYMIFIFLLTIHSAAFAMLSTSARKLAIVGTSMRSVASGPVAEHLQTLQELFPEAVLQRYKKDHVVQSDAGLVRNEWIKYACLVRTSQKTLGMFSKEVDNLWHTFLLFNKDYEEYCALLDMDGGNKRVLYHIPNGEQDGCPKKCQRQEKRDFIRMYAERFGSEPDQAIWKDLRPCYTHCDSSGDNQSLQRKRVVEAVRDRSTSPRMPSNNYSSSPLKTWIPAAFFCGGAISVSMGILGDHRSLWTELLQVFGGFAGIGIGCSWGDTTPSNSLPRDSSSSNSNSGSSAGCAGGGGATCGGGCGGGGCGGGD